MRRNMGRLRTSRLRRKSVDQTVNPLDGMANLADAMLVLACGLMLSLIVHWNVDVGRTEKLIGLSSDVSLTEVSGAEEKTAQELQQGQGFEEMGVVYRDAATGKLYVISKGDE